MRGAARSRFPYGGIPRLQRNKFDAGVEWMLLTSLQQDASGRCLAPRNRRRYPCLFLFFFSHFYFPASGQALVTGVVPSAPPRFLPSIFIAHRVQQFHSSSIFHRVLLTHALALSASQFVHKKNSQRIYTSMHSAGLELTKLTYTRLEDNLIRHRGDRYIKQPLSASLP